MDYKQYIGLKATDESVRVIPSVSVEGINATTSMNRVGISSTQFVCTIGNGSHPLIEEIRKSLVKKPKSKPIEKKASDGET